MKLLLLRHAESQGNASGNYSSAISDSLSQKGEQQALAIVDELRAQHIDRVIVSPLKRAQQTITPYLADTKQRAEIWPEIAEACWHDVREEAAESWNSAPATLPSSAASLFSYRDNKPISPAHPESFGQGLRRIQDAMTLISKIAAKSNECILMVAHGHVIRELLNMLLEPHPYRDFPHDNGGLTLISFNKVWEMQFCNRSIQKST